MTSDEWTAQQMARNGSSPTGVASPQALQQSSGGLQAFYNQNQGNPGAVQQYMNQNGYTNASAASTLGIDQGYVDHYLGGAGGQGGSQPSSPFAIGGSSSGQNLGLSPKRPGGLQAYYDQNKGNPAAVQGYMQQNGYTNASAAKELGIDQGYVDHYFQGSPGAPKAMAQTQPTGYSPPQQAQGSGNLGLGGNPFGSGQDNPYLASMADDIGRRSNFALGQAFNGIRSNAIGTGGLGGSRQGVAEGVATGMANDNLTGNLANLYGSSWNGQANRNLSRYQGDQGFYTAQRGQDQTGAALGADLMSRGQSGQWAPLQHASNVYSPYTGLGTTTQSGSTGGGANGVLGGVMAGGILGKNMGWWGSGSSPSPSGSFQPGQWGDFSKESWY